MIHRFLKSLVLASTAWALAAAAAAQAYPDKPVRFIVPFSAGGSTDVTARLLAESMGRRLGAAIVVENQPGAAGSLAAANAARAPADGYTVLVGGVGPMMVVPEVDPALSYRPAEHFEPVGHITNNDYVWVVGAGSPFKTAGDVLQAAGQSPGALSYMTTGIGGPLHVSMEYLAQEHGLRLNHVPYKGESQAVGDLLAGRIDVAIMSVTVAAPLAAAGKARILVLLSQSRSSAIPDVPTISEAGLPGHEVPIWLGLFVPSGTPADVVARLAASMKQGLADPAVQDKLRQLGAEPVGGDRVDYVAFLDRERERWRVRVEATGIQR